MRTSVPSGVFVGGLLPGLLLACSSSVGTLVVPAPDYVQAELGHDEHGTPMRMYVNVQIGSAAPFLALLDTGSSGLRVMEGTVPNTSFASITTTPVSYAYGDFKSSLALDGVVAFATVTIGVEVTPIPIPVMLIKATGCTAGKNCNPLEERFSAPAVLGVGMRAYGDSDQIGSPIAQLPGSPRFVVHMAADDDSGAFVRIGDLPSDTLAFRTFALSPLNGGVSLTNGTPSWNDLAIPTCITDETSSTAECSGATWDTGSPSSYVSWPAQPAPYTTEIAGGSAVAVTIGPENALLGSYSFVVGATPSAGVDQVLIEPPAGAGYINLGVALFLHYDALFDPKNGIVGLAQPSSSGVP